MKNRWLIYGFLIVMTLSLGTLAFLQYRWLGSVSEAEKERLQESLSASSENFAADFNEVFSELGQHFRIQIGDPDADIKSLLGKSYLTWMNSSQRAALLDSVYFIKQDQNSEVSVFLLKTDPVRLDKVQPGEEVKFWLENHYHSDFKKKQRVTLRPDLGNQSFLSVPVQLLDMIEVKNEYSGQNIEVRLNIDQLDDFVLLRLDDEYIKMEMIPEIARTYFSDSFEDQYQLSILKEQPVRNIYYTSGNTEIIPRADIKRDLDRLSFSNVLIFNSVDSPLKNIKLGNTQDSIKMGFWGARGGRVLSELDSVKPRDSLTSHFFTESISSVEVNRINTERVIRTDTTITASIAGSAGSSSWQLWLSFKEGSLDAFVSKTRNRNLVISFGILGILGISVVLIVVFSQRSKELADQQMMFVAGVSHELRTPVTVIRSAAENLKEGVIQDEERKKEYAALMLKEGRRLSDMIDQIMEFSGIQTGKKLYQFSPVNIEDFLDRLKLEAGLVLQESGMELHYSNQVKSETVNADADALFLAVSNLISNAIKFSGDSRQLQLRLDEVSWKRRPALRIQVQDYGIGIPESEQGDIFKPFFRGKKPVSDQVKGNGIGLSLVQKVVEAHNGEITVRSIEGHGATFSLIIPMEEYDE